MGLSVDVIIAKFPMMKFCRLKGKSTKLSNVDDLPTWCLSLVGYYQQTLLSLVDLPFNLHHSIMGLTVDTTIAKFLMKTPPIFGRS